MATSRVLSEQRARAVAREMLSFREWDTKPVQKGGQLLEESEYKHHASLATVFKGKSKTGTGDGKPDFLLIESATSLKPVLVIETKPSLKGAHASITEAIHYAEACAAHGHVVLACGIAGADKEICKVQVRRKVRAGWVDLTLHGQPIDWIPSPAQIKAILASPSKTEVAPERPSDEALFYQASRLNEILRECKIKDEFRPVYAATFMLALWIGDVSTDAGVVLDQINSNAHKALERAGKHSLSNSLRVDNENSTLADRAWEIIDILKKLNIRSFLQEHDYLGQLYETFFRYTGGNTIGQYFTPRHVIDFMCELTEIGPDDKVFDPACGTGGFLIGALNRMVRKKRIPYDEAMKLVKNNLFGIESEPATAALCITNMILRGDGKSGIIKDDCFSNTSFPPSLVDCSLLNPPFPHKKTDTPSTAFIDRALASTKRNGYVAAIVPYSLLVNTKDWHETTLAKHSLIFVATLPPDLFSPYASFNTAILVFKAKVPHSDKKVFFARISNDGFKIKKNTRVQQPGSQLPRVLQLYSERTAVPELTAFEEVTAESKEWSPEAYIENAIHSDGDFIADFEESVRDHAAFYVRYGHKLLQNDGGGVKGVAAAERGFAPGSKISLKGIKFVKFCLGDYFNIALGGAQEIEDLNPGGEPIVSTSEYMNGVSSWREAPRTFPSRSITVATDGSTCSSFVQEFPYYAFYKVAILTPKIELPVDALYFIAFLLRREKWRYVYARKFGKARLSTTVLYAPAKRGKPDFEAMAKIVGESGAFPIIESFRKAYKHSPKNSF